MTGYQLSVRDGARLFRLDAIAQSAAPKAIASLQCSSIPDLGLYLFFPLVNLATNWSVGFGFSDFLSKSVDGGFEEFLLSRLRLMVNCVMRSSSSLSLVKTFSGHQDVTIAVDFSDRINGTLLNTLKGHQDTVLTVAISPDGKTIVSVGKNKKVTIWNLKNISLFNIIIIESSLIFENNYESTYYSDRC